MELAVNLYGERDKYCNLNGYIVSRLSGKVLVVFVHFKRPWNYSANFNTHIHLDMEFHENSSKRSQFIPYERPDREMNDRTGMTNLVTAYPNLAQPALNFYIILAERILWFLCISE